MRHSVLIAPIPPSEGCVIWNASSVAQYPASSANIGALRFLHASSQELALRHLHQEPNHRALHQKGGLLLGSSLRVESALMFPKPEIVKPVMLASVPPVIIISASPY